MITYRRHLEIIKHKEDDDIESWTSEMDSYQLSLLESDLKSYPLPKTGKVTNKLHESTVIYDMSFGQFMMLENILTSELTPSESGLHLAKLVIRPEEGLFNNDNPEIERLNEEAILNSNAAWVESVIHKMLIDRHETLFVKHAGVVYREPDELSSLSEDEGTDTALTSEEEYMSTWNLYNMAKSFVNDDITRLVEAYDVKMNVALMEMTCRAQKSKIDEVKHRAEQARVNASKYRR